MPKDTTSLLGGKPDDASNGSPASRKRADNPAKPGDAASVAAGIGAMLVGGAPAADTTPAGAPDSHGDDPPTVAATNAGGASATLSAVSLLTATTQTGAGNPSTMAAAGLSARIVPAASGAVAASSPGTPTANLPTIAAPSLAPTVVSASSPTAQTPQVSNQELLGRGQPPAVEPMSLVTVGSMVPQLAGPAQSATPAVPLGGDAPGTANAATLGTTADASGAAAAQSLALTNGANPGAGHAAAAGAAGISPVLPAMIADRPATTGSGGAFGSAPRDRFTPITATQGADDTSAAALTVATGTVPTLPVSTATPTPGSGPDTGGSGAIADQVAGQLARMVSNGTQEMVMRLHPPELGDLTVRVAVSGRDVSAWFVSPQPQVQHAISAALGQLQANLGNAGYNLNGAWVGGEAAGGRQQRAALPQASLAVNAPLAASATPAATGSSRPASSGLNIYV
ncbi:MAG TPA: flagellar hook-length control protein FliK [Stellaceae bacterium]|nr:flagellar hook-length control protein FliK [Stellaceae bacterium]